MLLACLLADTLILTSPTTPGRDKKAAERLRRWAIAHGGPMVGEDINSFGNQLLGASAGLLARSPEEIIRTDMKLYEAGGYHFFISKAEVTDLMKLSEYLSTLRAAMIALRDKRGLDFAMLVVTDVVTLPSR
jgi:manganese-dependent inorganic pyrophosphatase